MLLVDALKGKGRLCLFISPSYAQVRDPKDGPWAALKNMTPPGLVRKCSETTNTMTLRNGSAIQCRSGDVSKQDKLRGGGCNAMVLDEYADMDPSLWTTILAPRLADTKGTVLFIGTPKAYNHFYTVFIDAQRGHTVDGLPMENWGAWEYTTLEGGRVTAEELERFRSLMTKEEFDQEFEARFTTLQDRVYHAFGAHNFSGHCLDDGSDTLHVGMDFNVAPFGISVIIAQVRQDKVFAIKAFSHMGDTKSAAQKVKQLYPDRKIICYPDPAGGLSSTTGVTDHKLLREEGFTVMLPRTLLKGLPYLPVKDRVNNTNGNLMAANGKVRLFINEKECEPLIKSLNGHQYDKRTGMPEKNKAGGHEHFNDALGYLLWSTSNLFRARASTFDALKV